MTLLCRALFRPRALLISALLVAIGCAQGPPSRDTSGGEPQRPETTAVVPAPAPRAPDTLAHAGRYRSVKIRDHKALRRLRNELGPARFSLVLKVNRRDSLHVRDGDSLMVPADTLSDLIALSPFPRELPLSYRSKLLLVSRRVQAFAAYDSGRIVRWGPTSTGRESLQTPEGLYHTNWKDKERTSTFNDEWLLKWYVNLDNFLGISFHQFDLPGYPASHSCVRLLEEDAVWLYGWSEQWKLDPKDRRRVLKPGTPVVVFGHFTYGKKSPWRKLASDSTATLVPYAEIHAALGAHLPGALGGHERDARKDVVADSLRRISAIPSEVGSTRTR